jgi:hypothetical protein
MRSASCTRGAAALARPGCACRSGLAAHRASRGSGGNVCSSLTARMLFQRLPARQATRTRMCSTSGRDPPAASSTASSSAAASASASAASASEAWHHNTDTPHTHTRE